MRIETTGRIAAALIAVTTFAACSSATPSAAPSTNPATTGSGVATGAAQSPKPKPSRPSPVPAESPVPVESSPPGDIPDNTAFVPYRSKAGAFMISVPEGWARATTATSVTFTDKLNTVVVSWQPASSAPTASSATSSEVPLLRRTSLAFRLSKVSVATLPAGRSVLIQYQENSAPNKVTGKQYRLDVLRYELFRAGTEDVITLLSPVGADNVDPWRIVTESFKWA